ncbi:hypothetical protein ACSZN3_06100 [Aeromonas hydrophila]|uniref:hypothetical protein n=1 Tax=Aeromonas hydrophila TaxID=644 RepID=UPI00209E7A38|nr:hypothetical protein [Aeromonas hydrophila]MCP1265551.1 hypothetical protein [Aeromonas hydrophila]MCP1294081.1 hypothetical protein [Aeromonas hydrophila]
MQEFRFKMLEYGDTLESFTERRMIIKKENGDYHVYKVSGFNEGRPVFDKNFRLIIEKGIGKIEAFDSDTEITIEL